MLDLWWFLIKNVPQQQLVYVDSVYSLIFGWDYAFCHDKTYDEKSTTLIKDYPKLKEYFQFVLNYSHILKGT